MPEVAMFEDAKAGDRVNHKRKGWGVISQVKDRNCRYPIVVFFSGTFSYETYTHKGYFYDNDLCPSLFWDEIKFDIPPRPKR